jgi:phosphoserine aminotransferase
MPARRALFVYGTLLRGERSHHLLRAARFARETATAPGFRLVDLGEYPGLVKAPRGAVSGELYLVDDETLRALDEFEGHPRLYWRTGIVLVDRTRAETYLLPPERARGRPEIPSGDWRRRPRSGGFAAFDMVRGPRTDQEPPAMTTERVFNFSAGPAVMPLPVLEQAQRELVALPGVGMSVLELSHRGKTFESILAEAEANLRRLLRVPDDYRVLFMQGGGQLQFSLVPMNFLDGGVADYVLTGYWGSKAVKEAAREGTARVAWSGKAHNYDRVPAQHELDLDPNARYVHLTSNETIQGVQFHELPSTGGVPLVCDGSSDFLSAPIDIRRYALLYACAQKNAGPAGVTVVIVSDAFLATRCEGLHSMLDYQAYAENQSMVNTPPTFAIYLLMLITRWIEGEGGLPALAERNARKAALLYDAIDRHPDFYRPHAQESSRSLMNVTFRLPSEELDAQFLAEASARGLKQLKGHRSVGGVRASIYNAMPVEGVEALRDFMLEFRAKH